MAVRIRMKKIGRKHRSFFRICAVDSRTPRDGRVLEVVGTYDPLISDTDARTLFNPDRLQHWLKVGALPSERVKTLIKKYGPSGTHAQKAADARARLALPKVVPPAPEPVETKKKKAAAEPVEEASSPEGAAPAE